MRGATKEYQCRWCGEPFTARVADRNRGWARSCSKACASSRREKKLGKTGSGFRDRQDAADVKAGENDRDRTSSIFHGGIMDLLNRKIAQDPGEF